MSKKKIWPKKRHWKYVFAKENKNLLLYKLTEEEGTYFITKKIKLEHGISELEDKIFKDIKSSGLYLKLLDDTYGIFRSPEMDYPVNASFNSEKNISQVIDELSNAFISLKMDNQVAISVFGYVKEEPTCYEIMFYNLGVKIGNWLFNRDKKLFDKNERFYTLLPFTNDYDLSIMNESFERFKNRKAKLYLDTHTFKGEMRRFCYRIMVDINKLK